MIKSWKWFNHDIRLIFLSSTPCQICGWATSRGPFQRKFSWQLSEFNFMFRLLKSDWTSRLRPARTYYNQILLSNVFIMQSLALIRWMKCFILLDLQRNNKSFEVIKSKIVPTYVLNKYLSSYFAPFIGAH